MRLEELKRVIKSGEDVVSVPCGKSSVLGIAARLRAGRFGVHFPTEAKDLSVTQHVSNRSGARTVSYSMVTGVFFFTGGEAAGA
jgi:hypothetical protein